MRFGWSFLFRVGAGPIATGMIVSAALAAQDALSPDQRARAREFAAVQEWQGIWEATEISSARGDGSGVRVHHANMEWTSRGKFTLRRDPDNSDPAYGLFSWKGDGVVAGAKQSRVATWHYDGTGSDLTARATAQAPAAEAEFRIELESGVATLTAGYTEENMTETQAGVTMTENRGQLESHPIDRSTPNVVPYLAPLRIKYLQGDTAFDQVAGVLTFADRDQRSGKTGGTTTDWSYRSRVVLFPVYDNLEVAVTIDGYAGWRPEGSIANPGETGNTLPARATLRHADGAPGDDLPAVQAFRFELLGTSREPGVCLNWPLGAADNDFDLRLAAAATGGELTDEDQKLAVTEVPLDDRQQPYAEVTIESRDFGGRAELRVVCELVDGREIIGLLRDESGEQDLVRLPKRPHSDEWVADSWRRQNDVVDVPATDDEEEVKQQQFNGDGFTLYEEYRGWVVQGKHRMGDPKRKDFFVLNQRGADFRGGIALFERLSKLRVHSTLRDGREISARDRRMNVNRAEGPHRVAQHAVVLARDTGPGGGLTAAVDGTDGSRAFRPRTVKAIYLEYSEAGRGLGVFSLASGQKYQLAARDAELAWDRAVAHELMHSVGVEHHGERSWQKEVAYFQGADAPLNPTGRPRYVATPSFAPEYYRTDGATHFPQTWSDDRGPEIKLRWEDTGRDAFEEDLPAYEAWRAKLDGAQTGQGWSHLEELTGHLSHTGKDAQFWERYLAEDAAAGRLTRVFRVGADHGTDSGHDLCVMKYYFANTYRMAGEANAYYLMRPGAVAAGRQICHAPDGTGGNAPDHAPQSRFGAAAGGRGNCFAQICPNDAIPPPASSSAHTP